MPEELDITLTPPRSGSYADLSRRMDRLETSHEGLARQVATIATSLAKIETSQDHLEELMRLRLDMVSTATGAMSVRLDALAGRFEDAIAGRIPNPQVEQYYEERKRNAEWREGINRWMAQRDGQAIYSARALSLLMTIIGIVTSAAMYLLTHVRF